MNLLYVLLIFVPVGLLSEYLGAPPLLRSSLSPPLPSA